uniref:HAT C-terminal dimerisation domain-containing protein n=1 Tax=Latimeria chalumnae TaxID=7897 RepID=H2ZWK5_LATCH
EDYISCKPSCSVERAKALNSSIVNIILKDLCSISIVEDKGFREFVELVEPGYQLPSRTFFIQMVEKKYLVTRIKVELKTPEKIALTSDIWTSLATETYMSVTAHFITKDWQLKSINLAIKPLSERHTGENIVTFIEEVLEKFELEPSCICALVCDNGVNMVAAARKLKEKYSWANIRCVGHTIQLVVNNALKGTMGAARCLVEHFHRSEATSSALKTNQQQMAVPQHSLKQGWNNTLHVVTRLLEQRWPVTAVLSDSTMTAKHQRYLDLQSNQWSLLEEVKQLLEPFEATTTYLGGEKYVSLLTVPLLYALIKEMQLDAEDSPSTGNFKTVALEQNNPSTENAIVVAAALDTRFRKLKFLKPDDVLQFNTLSRMDVTELVQPTHRNAGQSGQEESPPSIKQTVIDKMFSFEESSSEDSDEEQISCVQKKLMQYFSEKPSSRDTDPLTWWKTNQERLPHLSKLARGFLAIPATSTPSECLFSVVGTIASRKRASLTPQHVDMLVFLYSN